MSDNTTTFWARGAGGSVYEFDELVPGTNRAEVLAGQVLKGDLTLLTGNPDDNGTEMASNDIEVFLAAAAGTPVEIRTRPGRAAGSTEEDAPVPDPAPATPTVAPDEVPAGTIDDVIDWVAGDDDPTDGWIARAQVALLAEQDKDKPRSRLVAKLEDALASVEPASDDIAAGSTEEDD